VAARHRRRRPRRRRRCRGGPHPFEREDGDAQVAANGWPLYYYASDGDPGDVTGHGVRDVWWVLDPAGEPVRPTGETPTATATATDDFY